MGISLFLVGLFIELGSQNLTICSMIVTILAFQNSTGSTFWIYGSEIGTQTQLSIYLTALMLAMTSATFISPLLIFGSFGVANTFLLFACFQGVTFIVLVVTMKETKGLSLAQKKLVYKSRRKK